MSEAYMNLWRYNAITGYWNHVKELSNDVTLNRKWLDIFQRDEPAAVFKIARNKPHTKPLTGLVNH